jgi:hypothetical protein
LEEPEQFIDFLVKYKDWISISRQELDDNTKPEEVSFLLNNIRMSVESKYYKFLGIDTTKLDAYAAKVVSGLKGYAHAARALEQIESKEGKNEIMNACTDPKLKKIAESYLASKIIERLGIKTHIDANDMFKLYPELKIYKKKVPKGASTDDKEQ